MIALRNATAMGLLACLAACGREAAGPALPALPPLETIAISADAAASSRGWDGVVEAMRAADLTAQTGGRVVAVDADIGDRVAADAQLLRLSAVEQQAGTDTARAQLRAAEARAAEAEANFRRYAELGSRQFVSRLQLDQVRAARDAAFAERDAARAGLSQAAQQIGYTVVRAPFAGIVSARRVEPGESVAPGQPLMSLYVPDALRIEVRVPQSEAAAIRAANRADIVLADGRSFAAARVTVLPSAEPSSHSVAVRIAVPAVDGALQPGITVRVEFPIGDGRARIRIPQSAVMQRGETSAAYVLDGDRMVLRQLRLGHRVGDRVEVLSGLAPGETIAADPLAALQVMIAQRAAAGRGDD